MGSWNEPGLVPRGIIRLLDETSVKIKLTVSFLEIYNEIIKDLLIDNDITHHQIREDPIQGITIKDLKVLDVTNEEDVKLIITQGDQRRTKGQVEKNMISSKSHSILIVNIQVNSAGEISESKLVFVDLAGSEKGPSKRPYVETGTINKSLLALRNCINGLITKKYVPYRDSKLTRILKKSFEGRVKIVMIGIISLALEDYEDSIQTLEFASCVGMMYNKTKPNLSRMADNFITAESNTSKDTSTLKNQAKHKFGTPNNLALVSKLSDGSRKGIRHLSSKIDKNKIITNISKEQIIEKIKTHFETEIDCLKNLNKVEEELGDVVSDLFERELLLYKGDVETIQAEMNKLKIQMKDLKQKHEELSSQLTKTHTEREHCITQAKAHSLNSPVRRIIEEYTLKMYTLDFNKKLKQAEFKIKQRENFIKYLTDGLTHNSPLQNIGFQGIPLHKESKEKMLQYESILPELKVGEVKNKLGMNKKVIAKRQAATFNKMKYRRHPSQVKRGCEQKVRLPYRNHSNN